MTQTLDPTITEAGRKLARAVHLKQRDAEEARTQEAFLSLIHRHAVTYARIQESRCSEEMSERATARLERREAQIERRIGHLAAYIGCGVKFTGDPRGYCVRLILPDGRYNTWGGAEDGWGVA